MKKRFVIFAVLMLIFPVLASCASSAVLGYLDANRSEIIIDKDGRYKSGLEAVDTKPYDVFLAGESHAIKKNYDMQFALIQYLRETAGVRVLLLESGYASAAYLNIYLQTGDLKILQSYFGNLAGTSACNNEEYAFWQKLYQYNASLPQDDRLISVGIDIEHQWDTALLFLQSLVQNRQAPEEIKSPLLALTSFTSFSNGSKINELMKLLQASIEKHRTVYQEFLQESFYDFEFSVRNCLVGIDAYSNDEEKFDAVREPAMYDNFLSVYEHYGKGKFFGQFGAEHVYQASCDTDYFKKHSGRFAISLQSEGSPVSGRVCTVLYTYENCFRMDGEGSRPISENTFSKENLKPPYGSAGLTIFDLGTEGSPFTESPIFIKSPSSDSTLDYFQYIVLIRNSEACTLYKTA